MMKDLEKNIGVVVLWLSNVGLSFTDWIDWALRIILSAASIYYIYLGIKKRRKETNENN